MKWPLPVATGRDRQAATLDEEFEVRVDTEVSFVKLVPLVGEIKYGENIFGTQRGG